MRSLAWLEEARLRELLHSFTVNSPCLHTFVRSSCEACRADIAIENVLHGSLTYMRTSRGMILLRGPERR